MDLSDRPDRGAQPARATALKGFQDYQAERLIVRCDDRCQPTADRMLAVASRVTRYLAKEALSPVGALAERETLWAVIRRIEAAVGRLRQLRIGHRAQNEAKVGACASEHLPFEHLDAVDVAFHAHRNSKRLVD